MDGDGKENGQEFSALLDDLITCYAPEKPVEDMLVERIAVCYWRRAQGNP